MFKDAYYGTCICTASGSEIQFNFPNSFDRETDGSVISRIYHIRQNHYKTAYVPMIFAVFDVAVNSV